MSTPRFKILLPSSERKRSRHDAHRAWTFREAQGDRSMNRFMSLKEPRIAACQAMHAAVNGKGYGTEVLRLKGPALDDAIQLNLALFRSPLMEAIERESGPLYRALDAHSLAPALRRQIEKEIVIVCPLLGPLAPSDHVPLYRCPIGAHIPEWGRLHAFWKPHVTNLLNRLCRKLRVYSFLPKRLRALWKPDGHCMEIVEVRFFRRASGRNLPENAGGSRMAGEVARFLIESEAGEPEHLANFKTSFGHEYAAELSSSGLGGRSVAFIR